MATHVEEAKSLESSENPTKVNSWEMMIFLGLLLLLVFAPTFWDEWQAGQFPLPLVPILLVVVIAIGVIAFHLGRQPNWFSRWVWKLWLLGILLTPLFTNLLDTLPVYFVQIAAVLLAIIIGIQALIHSDKSDTAKAFAIILLPFFAILIPNLFTREFNRLGPCHALSSLKEMGCVRSVSQMNTPISVTTNPETGKNELIRAYETAVLIEPFNRWEAFLNTEIISLNSWVDAIYIDSVNNLLYTYDILILAFPTNPLSNPVWPSVMRSRQLIDLQTRKLLDEVYLDLSDPDTVQGYIDDLEVHHNRTIDPSEPRFTTASADQRWEAVVFQNDSISIYQVNSDSIKNPARQLEEIDPLPRIPTVPTEDPFWSFTPEAKYNCLSFSPSGDILAGFGEHNINKLDLYNINTKQLDVTVDIESPSLCPVFSANGEYIALANTTDDNKLFILDTASGEILTNLTLLDFDVTDAAFSSANEYLVISTRENGGLIFDLNEVLNQ